MDPGSSPGATRADLVGSLLRTGALKAARDAIEDREIAGVIAKQEAAGLQSVTDGEYRRVSWNIDFLELDNVESYAGELLHRVSICISFTSMA